MFEQTRWAPVMHYLDADEHLAREAAANIADKVAFAKYFSKVGTGAESASPRTGARPGTTPQSSGAER